jgi:hypothetical protein
MKAAGVVTFKKKIDLKRVLLDFYLSRFFALLRPVQPSNQPDFKLICQTDLIMLEFLDSILAPTRLWKASDSILISQHLALILLQQPLTEALMCWTCA